MVKITREFLEAGGTPCGSGNYSWNVRQIRLLGIDYPLVKGWIQRNEGRELDEKTAAKFLALKGQSKRMRKRAKIASAETTARDESIADLMMEAQIKRSMGEPIEDWLADMLPPWDS